MKNKRMKVLFLVNIPSPYRISFFNELGKICNLTVLFERRTSDERELEWFNNKIINFKAVFLDGLKINKDKALSFSVIKFFKKNIYDFIIIGGYATPTGMLAINYLKFRKIPFGLNADGGLIDNNEFIGKKMMKKYYISSADFWLSSSKITTDYFQYYGANISQIYLYPFTTIFERNLIKKPIDSKIKWELRNKLNITEEKVILSVGRFVYSKGFDVLLEACTKIPKEYGVYIVGGKPTKEYDEFVRKFNLNNVHFIGFKSKEELKEYYMSSDLFVLPTRKDVWGLVINEAMCYGLPVITTDKCVAGLELVKDYENGFIIPVNDSKNLAEKIRKVMKDNELSAKMSKNNLIKIKKYTIENMAKETMGILESILAERENN